MRRSDLGQGLLLADTLLDYVSETGWVLVGYRTTKSESGSAGFEIPVEAPPYLKARATPDSFRYTGERNGQCHFKVGRDFFHPGHDIGLRAKFASPTTTFARVVLKIAPIFIASSGSLELKLSCNGRLITRKSVSYGATLEVSYALNLSVGDVIVVDVEAVGVIDHLWSMYRFMVFEDSSEVVCGRPEVNIRSWGRSGADPLITRLPNPREVECFAQILDAKAAGGVGWGHPGFFRAVKPER